MVGQDLPRPGTGKPGLILDPQKNYFSSMSKMKHIWLSLVKTAPFVSRDSSCSLRNSKRKGFEELKAQGYRMLSARSIPAILDWLSSPLRDLLDGP